jgi:hypothetical protein
MNIRQIETNGNKTMCEWEDNDQALHSPTRVPSLMMGFPDQHTTIAIINGSM